MTKFTPGLYQDVKTNPCIVLQSYTGGAVCGEDEDGYPLQIATNVSYHCAPVRQDVIAGITKTDSCSYSITIATPRADVCACEGKPLHLFLNCPRVPASRASSLASLSWLCLSGYTAGCMFFLLQVLRIYIQIWASIWKPLTPISIPGTKIRGCSSATFVSMLIMLPNAARHAAICILETAIGYDALLGRLPWSLAHPRSVQACASCSPPQAPIGRAFLPLAYIPRLAWPIPCWAPWTILQSALEVCRWGGVGDATYWGSLQYSLTAQALEDAN